MRFERMLTPDTFEPITGDVTAAAPNGKVVLIPFGVLERMSEGARNAYGIYGREEAPADPEPVVPSTITNFQARAVLLQVGLFDQVDAWAKALGSSHAGFQAWEYANEFFRYGSLLTALAAQFGMTDAQLDELFILGASIEP